MDYDCVSFMKIKNKGEEEYTIYFKLEINGKHRIFKKVGVFYSFKEGIESNGLIETNSVYW